MGNTELVESDDFDVVDLQCIEGWLHNLCWLAEH
jgi:hypothetical protein